MQIKKWSLLTKDHNMVVSPQQSELPSLTQALILLLGDSMESTLKGNENLFDWSGNHGNSA